MNGEAFVTRCPGCETSFRVTPSQLEAASGLVRCGACLIVFSANENMLSEPAATDDAEPVEIGPSVDEEQAPVPNEGTYWTEVDHNQTDSADEEAMTEPVVLPVVVDDEYEKVRDLYWQEIESEEAEVPDATGGQEEAGEPVPDEEALAHEEPEDADVRDDDAGPWSPTEEIESEVELPVPDEPPDDEIEESGDEAWAAVEQDALEGAGQPVELDLVVEEDPAEIVGNYQARKPVDWRWPVVGLLLLLLLSVQVAWFNMPVFSREPWLRPYYEAACEILPCEVPGQADKSALRASDLIVRSHPDVARALMVDAVITNNADFRQRLPRLQLSFTDLEGRVVASRTFAPKDYLGGEMTGLDHIPARTDVRITIEILDPGPAAIGYSLTVI